jgi:hypothetical protein
MIVHYLAMNIVIAYVLVISVKNIVVAHQQNVIIVFLVVVAVHPVQQNNVHVMLQHVNAIQIYVYNVVQMISEILIMN